MVPASSLQLHPRHEILVVAGDLIRDDDYSKWHVADNDTVGGSDHG
jgi:hypothetical protein